MTTKKECADEVLFHEIMRAGHRQHFDHEASKENPSLPELIHHHVGENTEKLLSEEAQDRMNEARD